ETLSPASTRPHLRVLVLRGREVRMRRPYPGRDVLQVLVQLPRRRVPVRLQRLIRVPRRTHPLRRRVVAVRLQLRQLTVNSPLDTLDRIRGRRHRREVDPDQFPVSHHSPPHTCGFILFWIDDVCAATFVNVCELSDSAVE